MTKLGLYLDTIAAMKPEQIYYRLRKMAGLECTIGCKVQKPVRPIHPIKTVPELDFDPQFLSRFSVEEWMEDKVTFLHASHQMDWNQKWECASKSALWNFNLHYFEWLFPLWMAFQETGNRRIFDKIEMMIRSWIKQNPKNAGGSGWSAYTIDLRLTNWLSFYSYAEGWMSDDLKREITTSAHEQYDYLSRHLEKDIQGNHYFEDLKTLVLCAVFFQDEIMLRKALAAFKKECREEILEDGMHFELSPMYHNLMLEGILKVTAALREYGDPDAELEAYIQPMLNAAWSLGESLERIPLFNDSGDNVAKSLDALVKAAKNQVQIEPVFQSQFPSAGYYIYKKRDWKLIVDAGQPGPSYIPGHSHCDALSFELYKGGIPVVTNCGTYAYQSERRGFFRSTAAHNTVCINQVEQSQCWGVFRMAKRSSVRVLQADERQIVMEMRDQAGQKVIRTILFDRELVVRDETKSGHLTGYYHPLRQLPVMFECETKREQKQLYAPEYGKYETINAVEYQGSGSITLRIRLDQGEHNG